MRRHEWIILAVIVIVLAGVVAIVRSDSVDTEPTKSALTGADCGGPYVGLSTDEAIEQAEAAEAPWRIGSQDGKPFPGTLDYNPTRATFDIVDGKVTSATCG